MFPLGVSLKDVGKPFPRRRYLVSIFVVMVDQFRHWYRLVCVGAGYSRERFMNHYAYYSIIILITQ